MKIFVDFYSLLKMSTLRYKIPGPLSRWKKHRWGFDIAIDDASDDNTDRKFRRYRFHEIAPRSP